MEDEDWEMFTNAWLGAMKAFQAGTLSMQQAFDLIMKGNLDIDEQIKQFACDAVSEIDGYPRDFEEMLALLQKKPSRQDVLSYMET